MFCYKTKSATPIQGINLINSFIFMSISTCEIDVCTLESRFLDETSISRKAPENSTQKAFPYNILLSSWFLTLQFFKPIFVFYGGLINRYSGVCRSHQYRGGQHFWIFGSTAVESAKHHREACICTTGKHAYASCKILKKKRVDQDRVSYVLSTVLYETRQPKLNVKLDYFWNFLLQN